MRQQEKDWECFEPITLKLLKQAGVEPDTCFYIDNRQAILGKDKLDLTIDPPPDLAIEVDLTSITNIKTYEPLKIPELWVYKPQELTIYVFDGTQYQNIDKSLIFPDIDLKTILPKYIELAWTKGSSIALKQFEQDIIK